ncbi:MAG: metallophosphoesterase family protein [Syntrophaceae bacterium]|nr:metallophosphoesterase family protein [Syntrophaceae bacterium]
MYIFCISDIHGAVGVIDKVAGMMKRADLVVIAGDVTRSKSRAEAQDVITAIERINTRILAVHGNWDRSEVKDFLVGKGYSLHEKGVIIGGIGFFGLGGSSPTPMNTATEYTEEEIATFLNRGYEMVRDAQKIILVSHCPPRGVLDRTYLGLSGGSKSVRSFLETHRVDLCLCGHIHEGAGIETFRETLVANSGSFKCGSYLCVEITEKVVRVKKEMLLL